ncbi:MAG: metal ABC transporter permease [Eubacterium sp.]|nr:metal ABC transporter permease [Eubacterium sp.]
MTDISELIEWFRLYPFVRYALIAGVLIALCSSLIGVTLVLKRFSFIGDGLSHVAFGAMAIAATMQAMVKGSLSFLEPFAEFVNKNNMVIILPITVIAAIILLAGSKNRKIKGDAAIAMISVGSLAFGYIIMNVFSTSSNVSGDVCSTLFGSTSILTLSKLDVWLCVILSVVVITVFIIFYNKIFAVTFDENFARATGTNASAYNFLIAVIIAVIIVLAMNLVGSLLISALVIFPALSAMRVFKNFKAVVICSAVFSVTIAAVGIIASIRIGTPVGSTIVAFDVVGFFVFWLIGALGGKKA